MAIGSRAGILAGQAYVSLGLFSGDFEKGLLGAQQKLNNLGSTMMNTFAKATLAIGAASTGFGMFFKKINDDTIQLYRMSKAMGVSVEFLSALRYEAAQFNVKMEDIDSGLTQFRRRILQASLGSKEANETFSSLGVSWKEFAGLDPEKQILRIGEALSALPEGMRKAAGAQVFGDVGRKVFPIFESFVKDSTKAQRDGVSVTKLQVESALILQKVFTNLAASINSFSRDIMTTLGPTLMSLMKGVAGVSKGIREFALANPDLVRNIFIGAVAFAAFTASMWTLGVTLKAVSFGLGGLRSIFVDLPKLILSTVGPMKLWNAAFAVTSGLMRGARSAVGGIARGATSAGKFALGGSYTMFGSLLNAMLPFLSTVAPMVTSIGAIIGPIMGVIGPILLLTGGVAIIFGALKHIKTIFGTIVDGVKTFGESLNKVSNGSLKRTWELFGEIRDIILAIISGNKWDMAWEAFKITGTYAFLTVRDLASSTFKYVGALIVRTLFDSDIWSKGFAAVWSLMVEGFFSALNTIREGFALILGPTVAGTLGLSTKKTMTPGEIKEKMSIEQINPFTGEAFRNTRTGGYFGRPINDIREMFGAELPMSEAEKSGTAMIDKIITSARKRGLSEQAISKLQIPVDIESAKAMALRFEQTELSLKDLRESASKLNDRVVKDLEAKKGEEKIKPDTLEAKIAYDDLYRYLTDVPKKLMEEELPTPPSVSLLKQTFETFGTFSGFRLGSMGYGSSVQEKIASGIDELVKGQEKTNDILGGMEAPAFGG